MGVCVCVCEKMRRNKKYADGEKLIFFVRSLEMQTVLLYKPNYLSDDLCGRLQLETKSNVVEIQDSLRRPLTIIKVNTHFKSSWLSSFHGFFSVFNVFLKYYFILNSNLNSHLNYISFIICIRFYNNAINIHSKCFETFPNERGQIFKVFDLRDLIFMFRLSANSHFQMRTIINLLLAVSFCIARVNSAKYLYLDGVNPIWVLRKTSESM